jgi:hemerythrin
MDTDADRRHARLAARRKAWRVMSKATRRRMVRRATEEFVRWVQQHRQLVDSTVIES